MRTLAILALVLAAGLARAGDAITVYMYSEYIDPAIPEQFEAATGTTVTIDVYEAQEEMLAKLQAGGLAQYDVIVSSDVNIRGMVAQNLIQKLDPARIPNRGKAWSLLTGKSFDPRNEYTLPYFWGPIGIAFLKSKVRREQATWDAFFAGKAPGGFLLMDENRSMMGIALHHLGKPASSTDPADIAAAGELLARAKRDPRCLGFDSGMGALGRVVAGEAAMAVVYNGDAVRLQAENPDVDFVIPPTGTVNAIDNLCISAKAPNPKGAHAFINYLLDPAVAAQNANAMRYPTAVEEALPLIAPADRANPAIYPPAEVMAKFVLLEDVGEASRLYDEAWGAVKGR